MNEPLVIIALRPLVSRANCLRTNYTCKTEMADSLM